MGKQVVHTEKAPAAVGPYSQAIVANGMVFTAGQIALIPGTKDIAEGGVQEQARQVLQNLKAVLEAAGTSLENVVKTTVFLKSMGDFQGMNEVYARMFAGHKPARSTIAVRQNPLDALVEIECIAEIPE